ncbi:MAG: pantoate--beta-alanine ligase, partial [Candidatus Aminicenantales bacterium]
RAELDATYIEPEYLEVLAAGDLSTPSWHPGEQVVLAIAAQIGPARLIDNTLIELPVRDPEPAVAG